MIFVALSCLQSRPQRRAFEELAALPVDGIQLTPGCLPTPGFKEQVSTYEGAVRMHHGFAWGAYRRDVYDEHLRPIDIGKQHSVHPPPLHPPSQPRTAWRKQPARSRGCPAYMPQDWIEIAREEDLLVETMYPGEALGTGDELDLALDLGLRLAVDISHLHIQHVAGALTRTQMHRVLDSDLVEEIHVSENNGQRDQHQGLAETSFLLDWARERSHALPVVLESYWHRTPAAERFHQLELLGPK